MFKSKATGIDKVSNITDRIKNLAAELETAEIECQTEIDNKNIEIVQLQAEVGQNETAKDQAVKLKNNILGLLA